MLRNDTVHYYFMLANVFTIVKKYNRIVQLPNFQPQVRKCLITFVVFQIHMGCNSR